MLPTKAYAAYSADKPLAPINIERREPGPHDVLIKILYCGVCHTDITFSKMPNNPLFPMVPGHEIIGQVVRVGGAVTRHKVGDTVGVGCQVDSCRSCEDCAEEEEQFCTSMVGSFNSMEKDGKTKSQGGFSTQMVVDERFAFTVSPKLSPAAAAPLLCAGITVYSPLRHWNIGKGSKVGVLGLGGLGHMAVKLAAAMGAEVTVFSTSESKRADALRLGATSIAITKDPATFERLANSQNLILNTVSGDLNHDQYIGLLKRDGAYIQLGMLESPMVINSYPIVMRRKSVSGSMFGGTRETQEMLDFCAEHNIVSDIEIIPMDKINEAYDRILKNDVRYRFVIDMSTLK